MELCDENINSFHNFLSDKVYFIFHLDSMPFFYRAPEGRGGPLSAAKTVFQSPQSLFIRCL